MSYLDRFAEFEFEAYAADRDRLRISAIAAEDDSMERNYSKDLPFFVQEHEVRKVNYKLVEPKIATTKTHRTIRAKSA